MTELSDWLTVKQIAPILGVSERRVRFLIHNREVGIMVGKQWLVHRDDLARLAPDPKYRRKEE